LHVGVDLAIDSLFFRWVTTHTERVGRVLYASSSAAYPIALQGVQGAVALREDMLVPGDGVLGQPDMSYGWSKLTGEYLAHLAAKHYGVKVACVRPFSGYGEDQETCYPVAAIAQRVVQQENPVTVWGTGEQGRDFVHIDDCITAMLRASARITDGSAVNIGTGRLTTFLELAQLMVRLHGRHAAVVPQLGRPVGVQSRYADCTKQRELLDFVPRIDLETGMARVLQAAVIRHVRPEADARGQPHPGAVPHAIRPLSEHP
jgi:UDP-glucose 4-epimerase